ncbi:MAG TPA: thiamine pyrophosphate-dependent enzyme, partial [Trueperaceae bacterium]|nr:thiamine pyrophosphate-dependent enzyme [Trueperaceae bacterium]
MDTVRFVSPKGEVVGELPISDEELLAGYEAVARARHFDERAVVLQRQGRLGVYAPYRGQEAAQVGTAMALLPSDWLVPSYRETAAALTHGLPHSQLLLYWRAHAEGWNYPEGVRVLPFYIPIATQLLHAVGLAMAGRFQEEPWVTMVYVG